MTTLENAIRRIKIDSWIALAIAIAATVVLAAYKDNRVDQFAGDTALFFQLTENIGHRGLPVSQVGETVIDATTNGMLAQSADHLAGSSLRSTLSGEYNEFKIHSYLILYPIALLALVFPTPAVLFSTYALSFAGLILAIYLTLRMRGVSIAGSAIFSLLVTAHPVWAFGITDGQFYPDRVFVLAGFLFMLALSSKQAPRALQLAAALVCMAINERGAAIAGLFAVLYPLLFWKSTRDRAFKIGLGLCLLAYAFLILKFVLTNGNYSGFLPTSIAGIVQLFSLPSVADNTAIFFAMNGILLLLSLFDARTTMLVLITMLPNILGNIGGAEKTGWSTHYHDMYFAVLVWAAARGYAVLFLSASSKNARALAYCSAVALVLVQAGINPSTGRLSLDTIKSTFMLTFPQSALAYFGPAGAQLDAISGELPAAIPAGSLVTTIEHGMPFLYRDRRLSFYPLDIDQADYAVVAITNTAGALSYSGAVNFIGPAETAKFDALLQQRLRRDGYDVDHPAIISGSNMAVLKRLPVRRPAGT